MLFKVFEPKLVDSLMYAMIEFFNHGIQGTATWSQLSLVPHIHAQRSVVYSFVSVFIELRIIKHIFHILINNDKGYHKTFSHFP